MLITLRDAQDHITAVCEAWLVDDKGVFAPWGRHLWINQLELNPGTHSHALIQQIIVQLAELCPQAKGAYWERREKRRVAPRYYTRRQLMTWVDHATV